MKVQDCTRIYGNSANKRNKKHDCAIDRILMMSSKETIDVIIALTINIHTCVSMSVTMGVTMGVTMVITIRIHTHFTNAILKAHAKTDSVNLPIEISIARALRATNY